MGTDISTTFRNYLIIGVMNVPGSLLGGLAVELPGVGRKGAMSFATVLKGVLLFASTTAGSANALLGWNCGYAVTSNMMYGVLYGELVCSRVGDGADGSSIHAGGVSNEGSGDGERTGGDGQ